MLRRRLTGPLAIAVGLGLLAGALAPQVVLGLSFAAKASISGPVQFVGDSLGTTFTLKVKNTGTVRSIGAVMLTRPTAFWTVTDCPTAPSTWAIAQSASSCTYVSDVGTADNIQPKHSASFTFTATTAASIANRSGTWNVSVSNGDDFSNPSWVKQAGSMAPGLATKAFSFELTDFVVAGSAATIGDPCPSSNKHAAAGATGAIIVVCGTNHTNAAQLPKPAYSALSGNFVASPGTFASGSVAAGATNVVLGNWSNVTVASGTSSGRLVSGRIGAFSGRTSPATQIGGYTLDEVAPVATDDNYFTVDEDNTLNATTVLWSDTDANGDPLTAVKDTDPSHAQSFTFNPDGTFSYTPTANYHGTDSFTYHANDGTLDSNTATVTITINSVNDAPVANDDPTYITDEDTTLTVPAPGFLGNDTDVESDPLSLFYINGASNWTFQAFVVTSGGSRLYVLADGSFQYVPQANFHGSDSFTYVMDDGDLLSNTATVSITVNSVNDAPSAVDDSFSMTQDTTATFSAANGLLTDATDIDSASLTAVQVTGPSHAASFTFNADGSFSYQPVGGYTGGDSFTWKANDGTADSNVATMTITVNASGGGGGGGGGGCLKVC